MTFDTVELREFDEKYQFIPKGVRILWGDDIVKKPMDSFIPVAELEFWPFKGKEFLLSKNISAIESYAAETTGRDPEFIDLKDINSYRDCMEGTGCENLEGGMEWNAIIIAGLSMFAPKHFETGIEICGDIVERNPATIKIDLCCGW